MIWGMFFSGLAIKRNIEMLLMNSYILINFTICKSMQRNTEIENVEYILIKSLVLSFY